MQDAFVLLTPFIKGGRGDLFHYQKSPVAPFDKGGEKQRRFAGIPAQEHCGNDRCYKNLDDDGLWFSLAIRPLQWASKRKASGLAGGYLLNGTRFF